VALAAVLTAALCSPAAAEERIEGPLGAEVLEVIDGDTLLVRARIWLGLDVTVSVRLRGIDAPERRGRCEDERRLAERAREHLSDLVAGGAVVLTDIGRDKYAGRVIAEVADGAGARLAPGLVAAGLARPYDGAGRGVWCAQVPDPEDAAPRKSAARTAD